MNERCHSCVTIVHTAWNLFILLDAVVKIMLREENTSLVLAYSCVSVLPVEKQAHFFSGDSWGPHALLPISPYGSAAENNALRQAALERMAPSKSPESS
jgi:hypothetical protein